MQPKHESPQKGARADSTPIKSETESTAPARATAPFDALAAMKRRREAALRLPPLESGYRDPHFGQRNDGAA